MTNHKTLSLDARPALTRFVIFAVQVVLICEACPNLYISDVFVVKEVRLLVEHIPGLEFRCRLIETKGTLRQ